MELQTISSQMKVVIQKHQIIVTEMRNDPQNPVLEKRLRDLQAEIQSLNERQKQIMEDIRKNLEKKQSPPNAGPTNSNSPSYTAPTHNMCPSPQIQNQEVRISQKYPIQNSKVSTTTTLITKPNVINSVRHTMPPQSHPTPAFTFKAPVGTVVLPSCPPTSGPKTTSEQPKMHPVLVVPSPSNRAVDGSPAGVLFNLVPPIRVPQYQPAPSPVRQTNPVAAATYQKPQVVNNCVPVAFSNSSPVSHMNNNIEPFVNRSSENSSANSCEKYQPLHTPEKINNKIDQKKKDFFTALGLVSRDRLSDINSKRLERKRRSTANPQFSNAAVEERWRNAAAAAQASTTPPMKRPRGRPRLETKPVICPINGISSASPIKPCPVESSSTSDTSSANCTISSSSSPLSDSSTVMNGVHKQIPNVEEVKNVEQMLSGLCIVCTQPGDLVKCDTCAKQQHPGCMQPPLIARPQLPWQCSECQSRNVSLIVVQNYDMLRAAKEDEKRKLLKRSLELRLKRSQLESRLQQLSELSETQKSRQSEFQKSLREIDTILERLHKVAHDVRLCS
ncbi:hypothetical protein JTE90_027662 [Oedothorax gibbosus]|uniref:PHD-type domain-containing protein n=1 Tax=Oedothorax gibbosus TaxID=931172 RepID=A0AAV6UQY9_9ARAC|nr:hypothetical protein JTE90_027662 [Oedothorax gibbosus]